MSREEKISELFEFLPDDAKRVFESGKDGEEWVEGRTSIEGADAWFEYCDDCDTYHQYWYVPEYIVERGKITLVIHSVDTDGDWSSGDDFDALDDESMARYERDYGPDAWCKQYDNYMRHVAEEGDDPCGEIVVRAARGTKQTWAATITRSLVGLHVVALRREHGRTARVPFAGVPDEVLEYFLVSRDTGRMELDTEEQARLWAEWTEGGNLNSRGQARVGAEIGVDTPRSEAAVKREVIAVAKRHLASRAKG